MAQEIVDVFAEYEGFGQGVNKLTSVGSDVHIMLTPLHDSVCLRISSLSEVFLEWYLFDSSTEKNIKIFLETEGIADVFAEEQFMDLLCGKACLDDTLVEFVALKLPFPLTLNRLGYLNFRAKTQYIPVIKSKSDLIDKIREIFKQQKQQAIEKEKSQQKAYREAHHDQILEYDRKRYELRREAVIAQKKVYYKTHKEQIAEWAKRYREENEEKIKERKKLYWKTHKEEIAARRKKYRDANLEHVRKLRNKWFHEHPEYHKRRAQKPERKDYMKAYHKRYAEENREAVKKYKQAWYEANKAKLAEQGKLLYEKRRQQAEIAKKICAAYVFLLELRKKNKSEFLKLYSAQANPLIGMLKVCPALQNADIEQCPLHNPNCGNILCECCNQKVLMLPNITEKLEKIANALKQR